MRTAAVLPIKTFPRAKQRLRAAIPDADRASLAAAMVRDVLAALASTPGIDEVVVVTREAIATDAAREAGATLVDDPEEAGQSSAARRGIAAATADRVLLVPGDCPALDPEELGPVLAGERAAAAPAVVIVPDRHGRGTNALVLSPPGVIDPSFGPGSFARHAARARAAGAKVSVAELPSLAHDVDTPSDLLALRALLAGRSGGAPRTRAALEHLAPVLEAAS